MRQLVSAVHTLSQLFKIMLDFQHTLICTAKVLFTNRNYAAKELKKVCVMKTNLMHYLSSVNFISQPLHVSGIFVAHHQEVYCINTTNDTCAENTAHTNCCIYTVYLLVVGYKYARNV